MEWMEWLLLPAGALVFGGIAYGLFRWSRAVDAIFPDVARHFGLEYSKDKTGSALTNLRSSNLLQGQVQGIPLHVVSTYETRGRMRMRGTRIATRALTGLAPCTINVSGQAPASKVHLVPTGDASFDASRFVTSDADATVRALFTPEVRAALLACPQSEIRIAMDQDVLVLSFPDTPSSRAELQQPIEALLAIVGARR